MTSSRGTIRLVADREVRERLRARSFWILTALLVVTILAISVISRLAEGGGDELQVRVAGEAPAGFGSALVAAARQPGLTAALSTAEDREDAVRALEDGDVDVVVVPASREVVFHGSVDDQRHAVVAQAWAATATRAALADAGLSEAELRRALQPEPLRAVTIDDDEVPAIAVLVGTVSAILLFIALQTFGSYVLMGVVEEKSTAVIEVLLARAAPDQLLAGKVIGIGLCAAVQMAAAVGAGLVALAVSGRSIPADIWSTIPMVLVWFLGGYALYSTLFALAGSLVSRQEDAQAASAPIMTVMIAAYLAVFTFGYAPRSTASTVLSIFPPTAPLLMPMRMAAGAAAWWQVLLAVVLLVAAILGAWKLAGRIYGAVVLQRGTRISWKEALAAGRARA
jgi:ABC-2 type transport system permease protein